MTVVKIMDNPADLAPYRYLRQLARRLGFGKRLSGMIANRRMYGAGSICEWGWNDHYILRVCYI